MNTYKLTKHYWGNKFQNKRVFNIQRFYYEEQRQSFSRAYYRKAIIEKKHRFVQLLLNLYSFSLGRYKQNVRINCYLKRVIGLNVSRSDDVSILLTQLISKLPQSYRLILTSKISSWWIYVVEVLQQMFDKYNINMKSCTAVQQIKSVPWCLTYN